MDGLEQRVLEALARAAVAEKVAERALALAQDAVIKVEILRNTPTPASLSSLPPDPFATEERPFKVPDDKLPLGSDAMIPRAMPLSPFALSVHGKLSDLEKRIEAKRAEQTLSDSDMDTVRDAIWDEVNEK